MLVGADEAEVPATLVRLLLVLVVRVDDGGGEVDARVVGHQVGMAVVGVVDLAERLEGVGAEIALALHEREDAARPGRVQEAPEAADPAPRVEQAFESRAGALRHRVDDGVQAAGTRTGEQVEFDPVVAAGVEHLGIRLQAGQHRGGDG